MKTQTRRKSSVGKLVVLNEEELIHQISIRPVLYDRSLKAYHKTLLRQQYWNDISKAMDAPVEECRRRWRSLRDSFAKRYKQIQRSDDERVLNKHRKWIYYDKMLFLVQYLDSAASYELQDIILDEIGDNSEDGQSIDPKSETVQNDLNNEHLQPNEHEQQPTVCVQDTDFIAVEMKNHPQSPSSQGRHNNDDDQIMHTNFTRHQNNSNNQNNSTTALSLQCAETNTHNNGFIDSDEKFLLSCAPTLRRLTNRQNALARLKIQQLLFDIEFGQQNN